MLLEFGVTYQRTCLLRPRMCCSDDAIVAAAKLPLSQRRAQLEAVCDADFCKGAAGGGGDDADPGDDEL